MDQALYLFSGLRWQDLLDILLNAYILFRLYVLFRGTNVFRVLLAVCILWVFSQTAASLGLVITNWAMQGVITVATFIIIIIFRNEISNVIQTNDLKSFLWGIPKYQSQTPISAIAEAVFEMAGQKIGALMVLPLRQSLDNIVQGGVSVRARLSRETLVSIFWPDNPLHDGAAVIQGNRIVRAGVILPLTRQTDLPSYFGTRHRAALGVAQLTDALVIAVSEERGTVSLCRGNQTLVMEDRDALEAELSAHVGEDAGQKGFGRQGVELAIAGLVCLVAVSGIWLSFSRGMESLATHDVPIEFLNPEPKKEILSSSAASIKVLISGSRSLVNSVRPEQITVNLDLSQALVGENLMPITGENINLPPGVALKKIEPEEVQITLDTLTEKKLAVQPHWTGKLPEGLIMTQAEAVPDTVRVSGGGMVLDEMTTIFTEKIALDSLTQSGILSVNLVLNPASLELVGADKVQIRYFLEKKQVAN